MSREIAALLVAGVAVLLLAAMAWGWARRVRRDRGLVAPSDVPADASLILRRDVLYVATTRHGRPLERVAMRPLAYRSRATVDVTDRGVALALVGQPVVFIPRDLVVGGSRTTVAIDRVVEGDGLICLSWRASDDLVVDSILRFTDGGAEEFLAAVSALHTAPSPTGDDS